MIATSQTTQGYLIAGQTNKNYLTEMSGKKPSAIQETQSKELSRGEKLEIYGKHLNETRKFYEDGKTFTEISENSDKKLTEADIPASQSPANKTDVNNDVSNENQVIAESSENTVKSMLRKALDVSGPSVLAFSVTALSGGTLGAALFAAAATAVVVPLVDKLWNKC